MKLPMLGAADKLAEIRRLYFSTTKETILEDLAKALDLLKAMDTEDERERATVYMHGLNEMRGNWIKKPKAAAPGGRAAGGKKPGGKKPGTAGTVRAGKTPSRAAAKMAAANPKKKKAAPR